MLRIFQIDNHKAQVLEGSSLSETEFKGDIWLQLTSPSKLECQEIAQKLDIEEELLYYPLDEDEPSRIDKSHNATLIIINYPILISSGYDTHPLGILFTDKAMLTISSREPLFLQEFSSNRNKLYDLKNKKHFLLQIFYKISVLYMIYLRQLSKRLDTIEQNLKNTASNSELMRLLDLNKSLVYFSTALRANQTVLERLARGYNQEDSLKQKDLELLEDTIIENRQAMEMSKIYSNILSRTMDTYASIISNNLNTVMKFLTTWTIVIMTPTFFVSLYGMNVKLPLQDHQFSFELILLLCIVLTGALVAFFSRKKFF